MSKNFGGYLIKTFGAFVKTDVVEVTEINGVATGIIAMVGLAEKGPIDKPTEVGSYSELIRVFGAGPMVVHGLAAFLGGAQRIVCVRIGAGTSSASLNNVQITGTGTSIYSYKSKDIGTQGNRVSVYLDEVGTTGTMEMKTRYVDERGNETPERFLFPKFIPNPEFFKGSTITPMFFLENTAVLAGAKNYYYLYNRDAKTLREIPRIYWDSLLTKAAFKQRVADLKDFNESIVEVPYGTGSNSFPMAFVQQMVNIGSFGQAPSQFITLNDATPTLENILMPLATDPTILGAGFNFTTDDEFVVHPFLNLQGGANGEDGTGYYSTTGAVLTTTLGATITNGFTYGLSLVETEDVNFVQPAYLFNELPANQNWLSRYTFFKAVALQVILHVESMSSIPNRLFRTSILGVPAYKIGSQVNARAADLLETVYELSGTINSSRIQLVVGGFYSSIFTNEKTLCGADLLASFLAGQNAKRQPQISLTFAQFGGIFTDGLEFVWNKLQFDELIGRRYFFIERTKVASGALVFRAHHNPTSFTGSENRGFKEFIIPRIVDYANAFLYKNLEETFIGLPSRAAATAQDMKITTDALLSQLIRDQVYVTVRNVVVTQEPGNPRIFNISYEFQPTSEIQQIFISNSLSYTLA